MGAAARRKGVDTLEKLMAEQLTAQEAFLKAQKGSEEKLLLKEQINTRDEQIAAMRAELPQAELSNLHRHKKRQKPHREEKAAPGECDEAGSAPPSGSFFTKELLHEVYVKPFFHDAFRPVHVGDIFTIPPNGATSAVHTLPPIEFGIRSLQLDADKGASFCVVTSASLLETPTGDLLQGQWQHAAAREAVKMENLRARIARAG